MFKTCINIIIFSYLFWTDWAVGEAQVARANLDGSDVKILINNDSVEWPNGLTVDYIAERLYWVDARHDYIASCDLHGNNIKKVLKNDVNILLSLLKECILKLYYNFRKKYLTHLL